MDRSGVTAYCFDMAFNWKSFINIYIMFYIYRERKSHPIEAQVNQM